MTALPEQGAAQQTLNFTLNGQPQALTVQPWTTLLDLLREQLDLVGTKKGCEDRKSVV